MHIRKTTIKDKLLRRERPSIVFRSAFAKTLGTSSHADRCCFPTGSNIATLSSWRMARKAKKAPVELLRARWDWAAKNGPFGNRAKTTREQDQFFPRSPGHFPLSGFSPHKSRCYGNRRVARPVWKSAGRSHGLRKCQRRTVGLLRKTVLALGRFAAAARFLACSEPRAQARDQALPDPGGARLIGRRPAPVAVLAQALAERGDLIRLSLPDWRGLLAGGGDGHAGVLWATFPPEYLEATSFFPGRLGAHGRRCAFFRFVRRLAGGGVRSRASRRQFIQLRLHLVPDGFLARNFDLEQITWFVVAFLIGRPGNGRLAEVGALAGRFVDGYSLSDVTDDRAQGVRFQNAGGALGRSGLLRVPWTASRARRGRRSEGVSSHTVFGAWFCPAGETGEDRARFFGHGGHGVGHAITRI